MKKVLALGALILLLAGCQGLRDEEISTGSKVVNEYSDRGKDRLTVHLQEWSTDCAPVKPATNTNSGVATGSGSEIDSQADVYSLKALIETTSLWTSVEVLGLESTASMYAITEGDGEISVDVIGLGVHLSRPEGGANVGQKIVLEIDAIAQKQGDTVIFRISKENSGTVTYRLVHDDGEADYEIAKFTNDTNEGDTLETYPLDIDSLPSPLTSHSKRYDGPLFDAHVHLSNTRFLPI